MIHDVSGGRSMSRDKRESVSSERSALSDATSTGPPSLPLHRSSTDTAIRYDANEEIEEVGRVTNAMWPECFEVLHFIDNQLHRF